MDRRRGSAPDSRRYSFPGSRWMVEREVASNSTNETGSRRRRAVMSAVAAALVSSPVVGRPQPLAPPFPDLEAPVVNAVALAPFFRLGDEGRVDVVGLGDSNQTHQGGGWDLGFHVSLHDRFRLYATGLISNGENFGRGEGVGYGYGVFTTYFLSGARFDGAPPPLDAMLSASAVVWPLNYLYFAPGQSIGAFQSMGMWVTPWCPVDINANLRCHFTYGVFEGAGPGHFQPSARLEEFPYPMLLNGPVTSTRGPAFGPAAVSIDLPAAVRPAAIGLRHSPSTVNLAGPFISYYLRVENLDRPAGASFTTMYGHGAQSACSFAISLLDADDEFLRLFFGKLRELQGPRKAVLVHVNSGVNDRVEQRMSVGPNPTLPGNSAAAYADNMQAIINRVRFIWQDSGWDESELFFLLACSHQVSNPDDPRLVAYRAALAPLALSNPRTAVINYARLATPQEMDEWGWFKGFGFPDVHHLSETGFRRLSARALDESERYDCPRDLSGDGRIGVEDLYAWHQAPIDNDFDETTGALDHSCIVIAVRRGEFVDMRTSRPEQVRPRPGGGGVFQGID